MDIRGFSQVAGQDQDEGGVISGSSSEYYNYNDNRYCGVCVDARSRAWAGMP